MLSRRVGGEARSRHQAGQRGSVHDVPVALAEHQRVGGVHAVHDAPEVDIDHPVPVIQSQFLDHAADRDPGVVEDQIELAVVGRDLYDEVGDGTRIPDVYGNRRQPGPARCRPARWRPASRLHASRRRRVDLLGDRLSGGLVDIGDHDRGTTPGQRPDERRPDPRAAPGHDRHLAGEGIGAIRVIRSWQRSHLAVTLVAGTSSAAAPAVGAPLARDATAGSKSPADSLRVRHQ